MSNTVATTAPNSQKLPLSRVLLAGLVAIVGSLIANLVVYFVGRMLVNPPADFMPLASPQGTIVFTIFFLVAATIVYAIINALASNPIRVFVIVAWIALILGLIPDVMLIINPAPMQMGTPTVPAVLVLIVMHFVAFAITIWAFTKWAHKK